MSTASRVAFREGRRLYAAGLTAEQVYRLALAGRHFLAAHDWGVVSPSNPNYAIDGYGRELLLWTPPTPTEAEQNIWVYYCERPQAPKRPCDDSSPVTRTEQYAVATLSASHDLDPKETDSERVARILAGHAAGPAPAPFWPVAVFPNNMVHYTSLTASSVTDVQRRTTMQIGRKSSADPFWFAIWQNPGLRRYAADRLNSWFWGDLMIAATRKAALFTVSAGKFIKIEEKTAGSAQALLEAIRNQAAPRARLKVNPGPPIEITPPSVWNTLSNRFVVTEVSIPSLQEAQPDFKEGGAIASVKQALLLEPSSIEPAVAATRQIRAIRPKDPGVPVPVQIHCGLRQDSDFSTRFAVVGTAQAAVVEGLSVSGEGGIRIGGTTPPADDPPNMIFVNGTLELPPVKASILDPLFNPLLVLAYIAGLRRANSFGAAWLSGHLEAPGHVGVNEDFSYSLVLVPSVPLSMKTTRLLERFRLNGVSAIQNTRTESPEVQQRGPHFTPVVFKLPVGRPSIGNPGDHFTIEMEMSIKVDQTETSVLIPESSRISIEQPPVLEIDIDLDPEDFTPLNVTWSYTVKTEDRPAHLSSQKLTVTTGGVETLQPTDVSVAEPEKTFTYSALDDSKDVEIKATIDYQWAGNSSASAPLIRKKTVHVGGIKVEVAPALRPSQLNQAFNLKFTNVSGATISNIRNLKVKLDAADVPFPSSPFDLLDGESNTVSSATPVDLTGHAHGSQLTLTVEYGLTRKTKPYRSQKHTITLTL